MLVISRKQQEFVQIGNDIVIKIIKTSRGSVKIGIAAPEECRVLRGELSDEEATECEAGSFSLPVRFQKVAFSNVEAMKPVSSLV